VNKHLERVIAALEWKQMIQYGKANIKLSEANMQENYIKNLEQVLDKSFVSYQKLRTRFSFIIWKN